IYDIGAAGGYALPAILGGEFIGGAESALGISSTAGRAAFSAGLFGAGNAGLSAMSGASQVQIFENGLLGAALGAGGEYAGRYLPSLAKSVASSSAVKGATSALKTGIYDLTEPIGLPEFVSGLKDFPLSYPARAAYFASKNAASTVGRTVTEPLLEAGLLKPGLETIPEQDFSDLVGFYEKANFQPPARYVRNPTNIPHPEDYFGDYFTNFEKDFFSPERTTPIRKNLTPTPPEESANYETEDFFSSLEKETRPTSEPSTSSRQQYVLEQKTEPLPGYETGVGASYDELLGLGYTPAIVRGWTGSLIGGKQATKSYGTRNVTGKGGLHWEVKLRLTLTKRCST
ncbi:MAG: hypothetical protein ACRDF4_00500, partial [Rhabdochlamydiaceae bacterium]